MQVGRVGTDLTGRDNMHDSYNYMYILHSTLLSGV